MRTQAGVGNLWRAALWAGAIVAGVAAVHCGSSSSNGTTPGCTCTDGSTCPSGDSTRCAAGDAGLAADASDAASDDGDDASSGIIPANGPFCVAYEKQEEFYASFTDQCTCLDDWKQVSDAELYIAELDYYPGVYANAHLVPTCPTLDCCVRQVGDDGGPFPSGCRCSSSVLDCENDVNGGATATATCP